MAEAL
jgi:hypothetical protein